MLVDGKIYLGAGIWPQCFAPGYGRRHRLVTAAAGAGKAAALLACGIPGSLKRRR